MTSIKNLFAFSLLLLAGAAAGSAQAKYLCDAPPTGRDARACAAAAHGPGELRRFIQRMQAIESLQFSDYVNEATRLAWDARKQHRPVRADADLASLQPATPQR